MKYSVKMIIRYTVDTGEVFLEESVLMLNAASFDDAYSKAEKYVKDHELCAEYENMYGKRVHAEIISFADCFSVDDDEDVVEVYSTIRRSREALPENIIISVLEDSCTRTDMLPLRQWPDPDKPHEREELIEKAHAPFLPPWDIHRALVVYRDKRYTLGQQGDKPYLITAGKRYALTCHPYEPCLYITGEGGGMTAVHNAFDPFDVLEAFYHGRTVTSITGREYAAEDFCRMVEYAADRVNIQIDEAERLFGSRPKQKYPPAAHKKDSGDRPAGTEAATCPGADRCPDDPLYSLMAEYPACVIDYCIVKNEHIARGYNAHWMALVWACNKLMADETGEVIWHFDVGQADGHRIETEALFAPAEKQGALNYRKAFFDPPHGCPYKETDFERINAVLFPKGTGELEVYRWSTDWSEYFDDGHEWWGALCLTVYDKAMDRFAVILASATD